MRKHPHYLSNSCLALIVSLISVAAVTGSEIPEPEDESSQSDPAPSEETSTAQQPEPRPRLFRSDIENGYAPYHHFHRGYGMSPLYYGSNHVGYPFGRQFGYGVHGYRSPLYWQTFYGMLPAPGDTELSFSIGSDNYMGSSISTTQYLSKKHNIVLNMSALWETGEQWWNDMEYDSYTISPTIYWSNENTSIYASFEYSERNYADNGSTLRSQPMQRSKLSTDADSMSPMAQSTPGLHVSGYEPGYRYQSLSSRDHELERATIGVEHEFSNNFRVGFNFESRDKKYGKRD